MYCSSTSRVICKIAALANAGSTSAVAPALGQFPVSLRSGSWGTLRQILRQNASPCLSLLATPSRGKTLPTLSCTVSCVIVVYCAPRARILVQVTIYRRLLIGRDGHLDQSEAYDISCLVREYGRQALDVTS